MIASSKFRPKYRKSPLSKDDRSFLGLVKTLPCFVCFHELYEFASRQPWVLIEMLNDEMIPDDRQKTPTEAAHLGLSTSRRGLSQKYPARECGPLCNDHHTGLKTSHHAGTKTFWKKNNIERDWIIDLVQKLYEASK